MRRVKLEPRESPWKRAWRVGAGVCAISLLAACGLHADPAASSHVAAPRHAADVTILYTSDEHGWLQPFEEDGKSWGGAAETLAQWIADEGHCAPSEPSSAACKDPGTLVLSGGDNYTGPAVSTYFSGEPMAEALERMGYAASAFGNHDFDFGRAAFVKNRARSRARYLASNLRVTDPALSNEMTLPSHLVFERKGVRIGVAGIATDMTLVDAKASKFTGIQFDADEAGLDRAVREAWADKPDVVIAVAHECVDKLVPIVKRHPEWRLSVMLGAHCHKVMNEMAGSVHVLSPGWRFQHYVRVAIHFDPAHPPADPADMAKATIVDIARPLGTGVARAPEATLARSVAGWQTKLDEALGEVVGYTESGLERDSPEMVRWIAGAWKETFKADVALTNRGAIRQSLPKGPITKASIWSILPFDNTVMVLSVSGKELAEDMQKPETRAVGIVASDGGYLLEGGKKLQDDKEYRLATFDFLYFGGAKYPFKIQCPNPEVTEIDWRAPVVEWTKKLRTSAVDPLEAHLK